MLAASTLYVYVTVILCSTVPSAVPPNVTRVGDLFLVAELNEPFSLSFVVLEAAPNISEGVVWWIFTSSKGVMNLTCDNSSIEYSFSEDCLTISINQVEASNGGQYEFVAETRAGIGRSLVFLIVRGGEYSRYSMQCTCTIANYFGAASNFMLLSP